MRERMLRLTCSLFGFALASLVMICLNGTQRVAGMHVAAEQQTGYTLASTSDITATTTVTIYLPLVIQNCTTALADDFSDPTSGWPNKEEIWAYYAYEDGVYKVTPKFYGYSVGASPDWMVPNNAIIKIDSWADSDSGKFGLVFGLGYWEGTLHWKEWYAFLIEPSDQRYELQEWYYDDIDDEYYYDELAYGTSQAIISNATARQSLEVRRVGNSVTLVVNDVVLETVTDDSSPYSGRRSVGLCVQAPLSPAFGSLTAGIFDDFQVSTSGCITTTLILTSCAPSGPGLPPHGPRGQSDPPLQ